MKSFRIDVEVRLEDRDSGMRFSVAIPGSTKAESATKAFEKVAQQFPDLLRERVGSDA